MWVPGLAEARDHRRLHRERNYRFRMEEGKRFVWLLGTGQATKQQKKAPTTDHYHQKEH